MAIVNKVFALFAAVLQIHTGEGLRMKKSKLERAQQELREAKKELRKAKKGVAVAEEALAERGAKAEAIWQWEEDAITMAEQWFDEFVKNIDNEGDDDMDDDSMLRKWQESCWEDNFDEDDDPRHDLFNALLERLWAKKGYNLAKKEVQRRKSKCRNATHIKLDLQSGKWSTHLVNEWDLDRNTGDIKDRY